jgi:DNA invertase Pin-like site-specific DNA recombinase
MRRPADPQPRPRRRAAQYLRMSTEHQRYSPEFQAAAIAAYALAHGFEVVRTYSDYGVSGLRLQNRKGLQMLLADAVGGAADYDVILVYDVSRWGRFQNPDQSAHYEFLCAEAGIPVEYCAELFDNDGSLAATLMKGLKRAMAAEYSRDLSAKVTAGRLALLNRGYWLGGRAGYGLRRQMIAPDGSAGMLLDFHQAKALQGYHNILVPGPAHEVTVVRRIYELFVNRRRNRTAIFEMLNAEGIPAEDGGPWTFHTITQVLTSPKYVGDLVANRHKGELGGRSVLTPPESWLRKPGVFEGIVDRKTFDAAQRIYAARASRTTRQHLLEVATQIHAMHGRLTYRLIAETPGAPGIGRYKSRFGTLHALCAEIGAPCKRPRPRHKVLLSDDAALGRLAALHRTCGHLSSDLINQAPGLPAATTYAKRFGGLHNAYALVGFVPLTPTQRRSPVGRSRVAAAEARARRFWSPGWGQSHPPPAKA